MSTSTLATIPAASALFGAIGAYSSPFFDQLLPLALFAVGLLVGAFIIYFLIEAFQNMFREWWRRDSDKYNV